MSDAVQNKTTIFKIFQRKFLKDDFLRHTGIMVIGLQMVNVINLIYHLILVRVLSYEEYGTFNALIIISLYFCQFASPFQPALTRSLSAYFSRNQLSEVRFILQRAARDVGLFSILVLGIFILAAGPLAAEQQISDPFYLVLVGVLIGTSFMVSVPRSFLQGAQLFKKLAIIGALATLSKLIIGIGLVLIGLRVSGALTGYIAAPIFILITGFIIIKRYLTERSAGISVVERVDMRPIYKYYIPTGLVLFSFTVLTNGDMTLVKKFFSPLDAGYYSVAQMVGKIILFLPGAVAIVIFPKAAAAHAQNSASKPLLKKGLLITALFCGLGTLTCLISPRLVLQLLTGKTNPISTSLVIWFATAMSFYALVWLMAFYNLSIRNTRFIKYMVVLGILQTLTIYLHHPTLKSVLSIMNIFSVINFIVIFVLTWNHSSAGRDMVGIENT